MTWSPGTWWTPSPGTSSTPGLSRHALRLRDTEEMQHIEAMHVLEQAGMPAEVRPEVLETVLKAARSATEPELRIRAGEIPAGSGV